MKSVAGKTLLLLFLLLVSLPLAAQRGKLDDMRARARAMQMQIADKEKILLSSQKDVKSKMQNLDLLTAQIKERILLVALLRNELKAVGDSIAVIDKEVKRHEALVEASRGEYAQALRVARHYGSLQDKLLFVVSADDFNAMIRRYRYVRQYMNAHRAVAEELKNRIAELELRKSQADSVRAEKERTLSLQNDEQKELLRLEAEQRRIVDELRKESKKVKKELERQRNKLAAVNKEIDALIEAELAKQRKSKTAAADKKKTQAAPRTNEAVSKMSGSFLQNRGKLPAPLTGPYHLVSGYGLQNGVTGKGSVMVDNGGIVLQGKAGAQARCIFDGEVVVVFRKENYALVIVEHDRYMSVYCQLDKIHVKKGDKVKAGAILGDIAKDSSGQTRLLFQLRDGKQKLNPTKWLKL